MDSIWTQTVRLSRFEPLPGDIKTDILVIGGGIAGLLCAYELTRSGVDCVLVEADGLCGGITKNTTAKITAQHGLIYDKLIREFGMEAAKLYLQANLWALERYGQLCRDMNCDFERQDSYVYSLNDKRKIEKEMAALDKLGYPARHVADLPLPFPVAGAVCFVQQAQFHPLKFAAAMAGRVRIFEHTKVLELAPGGAKTDRGTVRAEKIIVATHFPVLNKHGRYFLKLYQHRSYVLALKDAPLIEGMYVDEAKNGLSFRRYGDLLLLGGGGHRTGKRGGNWRELEQFAAEHFPKAKITAKWAAQDCMTLDGVPYIGQYSGNTPDLYVATGFNKWGMTTSMAAAAVLCDMVQGKEHLWARVFQPSRTSLRPQLAVNAAEAAVSLLMPTTPRCPHMGCALKFNPEERSWDCPCHGSRFTREGKLIDNPATDDKRM